MSYPLRLPAELDAEARERCARLGISLNALIAVALDAYLRAEGRLGGKRQPRQVGSQPAKRKPQQPAAAKVEARDEGPFDPDPMHWRNLNDPDMWPFVDPDWDPPPGIPEEDLQGFERAYWATHQRPEGW